MSVSPQTGLLNHLLIANEAVKIWLTRYKIFHAALVWFILKRPVIDLLHKMRQRLQQIRAALSLSAETTVIRSSIDFHAGKSCSLVNIR
ncbi:MAG: hypothetical protein ABS24_07825 [SAR92 bacterium BACL26 MAG-121220-bin70]|uniref:Uncharacterized protein n=1 Tax=SAR92 bacterium BACL26 MAG-121220-bin70 TaxID=1655626 RepID=A0A0R2U8M9_9GAMM|nr:MAG: hypothetical protein ABS24_07825 [SAR92 bacterium BACL26 MAG-121220-bin70]